MSSTATSHASTPTTSATLLGHPRGLVILFFTEMWERFSYYGMRSLLILYLTQHFLFSDERSNTLYGAYTALVFVMTIIGGTLADRYLGSRKSVTFGAILLVLGHCGMALEGSGSRQLMTYQGQDYQLTLDGRGGDANRIVVSAQGSSPISFNEAATAMLIANPAAVGLPAAVPMSEYTLRVEVETFYQNAMYLSLALIIAGVGFLKANISTIVGALYGFGDSRRDSGFTIFYMGINLGSFLSSVACGYLGIVWGWKYGFGLAGIGMVLGLAVFLRYQHWLEGKAEPPDPVKLRQKVLGPLTIEHLCYLSGLAVVALSMLFVVNADLVEDSYVGILGLVVFAVLVGYAFLSCHGVERDRLLAALYFILAQIPFWALIEQTGSSLTLYTDRLSERSVLGWNVPTPVFQALNAAYIVMFAPLLAWLWIALARRGLNPSAPVKFAIGVASAGFGFLALVAGMELSGPAGMTAVSFLFLLYWIHTMGELLVSPVGLSLVTKLAPARAVGLAMGAWFLYSGLANYLSGVIAESTGAETIGGQLVDVAAAKATYIAVYSEVGYLALGIAVLMLALAPFIRKLMHGAD